nr:PREDICTED: BSD domain-containing protein 1-A-like isoform X1 [Bemisia tabaci]
MAEKAEEANGTEDKNPSDEPLAEGSKSNSNGSNWWGSWYSAAKNKSVEVLDFVKKDFDEFSTAVKSEASSVVKSTSTIFKETLQLDKPESTASNVKRSVSTFLDQVGSALNPVADDSDEEAILIKSNEPVAISRLQAQILEIASNPKTFLTEIEECYSKQFEAWLEVTENEDSSPLSAEKLTKLLHANPKLQENYEALVPSQVSHAVFWQRFLFRKALLEDEEANLQRKILREKQLLENYQKEKEKGIGAHLELTEDQQIKILNEYDEERRNSLGTELARSQSKSPDGGIPVREKKDMVIVGDSSTTSSTLSSGDKESTEDDWEKDFEVDDAEIKS